VTKGGGVTVLQVAGRQRPCLTMRLRVKPSDGANVSRFAPIRQTLD
jgi:hypothetical protein